MIGTTEKLRQYALTLERAYASMVTGYISSTFYPCIENPKDILQWRYFTTNRLLSHAEHAMRMNSPQKDINDFLGLIPDIWHEHISGDNNDNKVTEKDEDGNIVPTRVIKDIDRQLCNYLRNELSMSDDDYIGMFYGLSQTQRDAIRKELDRPLSDYYKSQKAKKRAND